MKKYQHYIDARFQFFLKYYICFQGGIYLVQLMDTYGAPISIIFVVFLEAIAISWIYGNVH